MADTSLIFNIIARDSGLGRALDGVTKKFRSAGDEATAAMEKAGSGTRNLDQQIQEAQTRVRSLAEEFERTGDKTIFGKIARDRSLISQLSKVRAELKNTGDDEDEVGGKGQRLMGVFSRIGSSAAGFGSSLASAGSSASGMLSSVAGLAASAFAVAAFGTVAAPALYAFGGAAAALPGLLSGAIAALFTLKLGFSGLSENWKAMNAPKAGGGGGGKAPAADLTPKIRAVEQAQRDVVRSSRDMADAQDDLRSAQLAVAKAHETAAEKLSDLSREYRSAQADQRESAQSLLEAQQDLNLALARGNPDEIRRAQMAVDKQALSVEDAADKADDLGKEYVDASRKGIEGSDEVVSAKKAEHDAQERVTDAAQAHQVAVQRLADAQKDLKTKTDAANASGGAMAAQLPRIAASAQAFLDELKRLKPAFDDLRLDIQQRLFEGLAGKLAVLANVWLPRLHEGLGAMATMFNGVFKTAFDSLSKTDFVNNIMTAVSHATGAIGKIGQAIAGPLIDAFGRLARASSPVLDVLGTKIAGIITKFADWIKRLDESGALDRFMSKAAHVIGGVFDVMTDLARIAGDVISILFGTNLGSTSAWDNLAAVIHKIADWLSDPKVQAKISDFINKIGGLSFQIAGFLDKIDDIQGKLKAAEKWFQDFPNNVSRFLSSLPGTVSRWISSAMDQLGYWIGYGIGWAGRQFLNLPSTIYNAIRSLPGIFSNIGSWLLGAVSSLYGWMTTTGRNIVLGIWNGIASLSTWLWNKAADFARGIYRGVKDALGISSPSKVMADEVGRWIPAGIAKGMDENSHVVQNAIGRMADMLSGTTLPAPAVAGMDQAMDAVAGTLTVGARSQRIEVRQVLDVTGQEGKLKGLIREMARTGNLYQDRG